jgi:hypothetical protein
MRAQGGEGAGAEYNSVAKCSEAELKECRAAGWFFGAMPDSRQTDSKS